MNSAVWLGHWQKRLLTCLCKTDRQQTSDIQQRLTWQTGNQQRRYLLIYFVWMEFIWFYVWSTCPRTVIYCNVLQWSATKWYKRPHVHNEIMCVTYFSSIKSLDAQTEPCHYPPLWRCVCVVVLTDSNWTNGCFILCTKLSHHPWWMNGQAWETRQ